MPETMGHVEEWRMRAEEIRATAEDFASSSAKEAMLDVAQTYERMADDLEIRLRQEPQEWIAGIGSAKN
jgi:molecular chaperone GrpE (heat shock protein)